MRVCEVMFGWRQRRCGRSSHASRSHQGKEEVEHAEYGGGRGSFPSQRTDDLEAQ